MRIIQGFSGLILKEIRQGKASRRDTENILDAVMYKLFMNRNLQSIHSLYIHCKWLPGEKTASSHKAISNPQFFEFYFRPPRYTRTIHLSVDMLSLAFKFIFYVELYLICIECLNVIDRLTFLFAESCFLMAYHTFVQKRAAILIFISMIYSFYQVHFASKNWQNEIQYLLFISVLLVHFVYPY